MQAILIFLIKQYSFIFNSIRVTMMERRIGRKISWPIYKNNKASSKTLKRNLTFFLAKEVMALWWVGHPTEHIGCVFVWIHYKLVMVSVIMSHWRHTIEDLLNCSKDIYSIHFGSQVALWFSTLHFNVLFYLRGCTYCVCYWLISITVGNTTGIGFTNAPPPPCILFSRHNAC